MLLAKKAERRKPAPVASELPNTLTDEIAEIIHGWDGSHVAFTETPPGWRQLCRQRAREVMDACEKRKGAVDGLMDDPAYGWKLREIEKIWRALCGALVARGRDYSDEGRGIAREMPEALSNAYSARYKPWADAMSARITITGRTWLQLVLDYIDGYRPQVNEIDCLVQALEAY